ncbi:TetR/AcrR family transcriptional regulator [Apibacter raozihei]|uniref:TetR/AcrR family transcriptional regulator n=1 Tax=Apibacter TaxID=1778601 RepID=UPI001C86A68C|nr:MULTISPECIES: TetR/AcrR family transcriptional regulator [Apibacter]
MITETVMDKDISTEEKIKKAAKKVFQKKGFGLTRTRDIAEEADINLALLNYYYRSKEKLFEIVMQDSMREMLSYISTIINDENTSLSEKIDAGVARYIDGLMENPHLPVFVFSELQANPVKLLDKLGIPDQLIAHSSMYSQLQDQIDKKNLDLTPLHLFVNLVSLSIFPIMSKPLLSNIHKMEESEYLQFIEERKIMIPIWLKAMLQLENT